TGIGLLLLEPVLERADLLRETLRAVRQRACARIAGAVGARRLRALRLRARRAAERVGEGALLRRELAGVVAQRLHRALDRRVAQLLHALAQRTLLLRERLRLLGALVAHRRLLRTLRAARA